MSKEDIDHIIQELSLQDLFSDSSATKAQIEDMIDQKFVDEHYQKLIDISLLFSNGRLKSSSILREGIERISDAIEHIEKTQGGYFHPDALEAVDIASQIVMNYVFNMGESKLHAVQELIRLAKIIETNPKPQTKMLEKMMSYKGVMLAGVTSFSYLWNDMMTSFDFFKEVSENPSLQNPNLFSDLPKEYSIKKYIKMGYDVLFRLNTNDILRKMAESTKTLQSFGSALETNYGIPKIETVGTITNYVPPLRLIDSIATIKVVPLIETVPVYNATLPESRSFYREKYIDFGFALKDTFLFVIGFFLLASLVILFMNCIYRKRASPAVKGQRLISELRWLANSRKGEPGFGRKAKSKVSKRKIRKSKVSKRKVRKSQTRKSKRKVRKSIKRM